ncbi:dihydroneopterin aldolase [Marinomonas epiphytica]
MQDVVFIEGLQAKAVIGVYDWEKQIQQDLLFDLEMYHDNQAPAKTDDLALTLDYEAISNHILAFCQQRQFELIETLAEVLVAELIDIFSLTDVTLTLKKPAAVPQAKAVGVRIRRQAQ